MIASSKQVLLYLVKFSLMFSIVWLVKGPKNWYPFLLVFSSIVKILSFDEFEPPFNFVVQKSGKV